MTIATGITTPVINQPNLFPITSLVGTSVNYGALISETYQLFQQAIGLRFNRSNDGTSMTDTLPIPTSKNGLQSALPNGWTIAIQNIDGSASITITPSGYLINGSSSPFTIAHAHTTHFYTDNTNYFTETVAN